MHLLGGIGMYYLVQSVIPDLIRNPKNIDSRFRGNDKKEAHSLPLTTYHLQLVPLVAALFYQFNFAVIQMFYLPFEPFITHFGFLPWLLLTVLQYFKTRSRRSLAWFTLLSFLATPQAHVPTVFLVYLMVLGTFLLIQLLKGKKFLKPVLAIISLTFLTNAFWGLQFAWSTYKNAGTIADSKNNQMATDEIFLKNREYGDFASTALMRSFSLEFVQFDHEVQKSDYMLASWKNYIDQPVVKIISWGFFVLAICGLVSVLRKKEKSLYPFAALFIFTFLIIGNDIPVLSVFSYVLRTYVPLFHNVFRFVFTKFFVVYAFSFTVLLLNGIMFLIQLVKQKLQHYALPIAAGVLIVLLGIYALPVFSGNFLHRQLRVAIPPEYFEVFKFFQNRPVDERVAIFPLPWYWGWTQYRWGTIGSGFQWFGIPQPTLDLAFDPWSQQNENYYWEITRAVNTSEVTQFESALEKYHVSWLLVDGYIINPEKAAGALNVNYLEKSLATSNKISLIAEFGRLKIYLYKNGVSDSKFVSLINDLPNSGPAYTVNDNDLAATEFKSYTTDPNQAYDAYYPFRSLFTGKTQKDLEFAIEDDADYLKFMAQIPENAAGYELKLPAFQPDTLVSFEKDNWDNRVNLYPEVYLDGNLIYKADASESASLKLTQITTGKLEVRVPKVFGYYSYNSDPWNDFDQNVRSCNLFNTGDIKHELLFEDGRKILRLTSVNSSNCVDFNFAYLPLRLSYLLVAETKNTTGRGLFLSVKNMQTDRVILDTYLESESNKSTKSYLVIPPMESHSLGLSINIDNISVGREQTVNDLKKLALYQIPYDFISQIKLEKSDLIIQSVNSQEIKVNHNNPAIYRIDAHLTVDSSLILWQGNYDGWLALQTTDSFPFFKPVGKHVLVNNWANAWRISCGLSVVGCEKELTTHNSSLITVYLVFWPQLLQWLGFGLLVIPVIFFIRKRAQ